MSYRTANLQILHFIYYSTNICTEYFKHAAHTPFFFSSSKCRLFHNATFFGSCVIHLLYTGCAKIKKIIRRQRVNLVHGRLHLRWFCILLKGCFASGFQVDISIQLLRPLPTAFPNLPILLDYIVVTSVAYKFRYFSLWYIIKPSVTPFLLGQNDASPSPYSWAPFFYVFR